MEPAVYLTAQNMDAAIPIIDRVLDSAVDAAAVINYAQKIVYISPGFAELTGQTMDLCGNQDMSQLKINGQDRIAQVLSDGIRRMGVPMHIGSQLLLVNLIPVMGPDGILGVLLLVTFRSIAVLKRAIQALERIADRAIDPDEPVHSAARRVSGHYTFSDFIGEAENVLQTIEQCQRISRSERPVLLIGETGVGKEIIADAIYSEYSGGRSIPFIKINCSAIPKDLLESELFGHEKGAFTGASALKKGKFELASGGILLLDEIGEMDLSLQSKLLRVLEAREFERIGSSRVIPMNARIIASTNQDLKQMVADGKFRMDLYYRLNTFEITIPPLRSHKEDIPLLMEHFFRLDQLKVEFSPDARNMMLNYDWPGNVRELRNVLNRLYFLYPNTIIGIKQVYNATGEMFRLLKLPKYRNLNDPLPAPLLPESPVTQAAAEQPEPETKPAAQPAAAEVIPDTAPAAASAPASAAVPAPAPVPADDEELLPLHDYEKQILERAIRICGGNLTLAAAKLGISRSSIYNKIRQYEISV